MEQTISGIFMQGVVEEIKLTKGDAGLILLKEKIGYDTFSAFKRYPMDLDVELAKASCEILYGNDSSQSYQKLGMLSYNNFKNSVIGKTVATLTGTDFSKIALLLARVFESFSSGITIRSEKVDDHTYTIVTENNPYNIHHYEGIWMGALQGYGMGGVVTGVAIGPNLYEYTVRLA